MLRKITTILLVLMLATGLAFIGCGGGDSIDPQPDPPGPGPNLCPVCGENPCRTTPPELPAGSVTVPEGAVWLGCWAHNIDDGMTRWDQIRWEISPELRHRIVNGELNQLWLIVDPDEIDPALFAVDSQGVSRGGLSSVLMIINSSSGWKQQGRPHYHRTTIPIEEIRETDNLLKWYLDWTPDFDLLNGDEAWFQIFIQHSPAGGGMPNVAPVAAFLAPRTSEDPLPPDTTPVNAIITVAGAEQIVTVTGRSGAVSRINDPGNEARVIGYELGDGTGGHRGHYAWFGVELGQHRLSSFSEIRFTFEGVAGGSRRLALIASTTPFSGSLSNHQTRPADSGSGYLAGFQVTAPMGTAQYFAVPTPVTLEILPNYAGDSQFDNAYRVYLSIYEHTAAEFVFRVTNIELVLGQDCPDCGQRPCQCCPVCGNYPCLDDCCLTCEKDPCECCPITGNYPCMCGVDAIFSFAEWFAETSPAAAYLNSATTRPLARTSSGVTTTTTAAGIEVNHTAATAHAGVTIWATAAPLNLNPAQNRYQITVTGEILSGTAPISMGIFPSTTSTTPMPSLTGTVSGGNFTITGEIPEVILGAGELRILPTPNGAGHYRITSIEIGFIGPRN